jgi:hypothetical protein
MVGVVRKAGDGSVVSTVKAHAKKAYTKTQTALKVAALFSSIARHAAEVAEIFKELPEAAKIGLGASKFPGIINGFLSIQKAAEDVWESIKEPGKARFLKRFEASCKLLVHLDSVTRAVANSLKFLKTVGAVGLRVVKWVPIFNIVSYIIGFISLGLASYSVHKSRKLLADFEIISRDFNAAKTDDAKALVLERAIDLVENEGIESLRKELRLSKASKRALLERMGTIRMRRFASEEKSVSDAQAIADMNEAFMILRDRLKVQLGYKCANLANQVVEAVGETLMLTPAAPVGVGIVLATSVCSLVTFAGRSYFINKNPFDPQSESKAAHLLTNLKGGFEHVRQAIHVHRAVGRSLRPA